MSYTKCISANPYKAGNYVTGALPTGQFQTYFGETTVPNVGAYDTQIDRPLTYNNLSLAATGQIIKASPGKVYSVQLSNVANAVRYVKFYNKATAPTHSDTPTFVHAISANSSVNISYNDPSLFTLGISVRATTGVADADTGAPTANDVVVNIQYK